MGDWLLGIFICCGIVFIVSHFTKPVNKGMTIDDYNELKREWKEEDLENQRFDDYIDGEVEMGKEKLGINSNKKSITDDNDLPL